MHGASEARHDQQRRPAPGPDDRGASVASNCSTSAASCSTGKASRSTSNRESRPPPRSASRWCTSTSAARRASTRSSSTARSGPCSRPRDVVPDLTRTSRRGCCSRTPRSPCSTTSRARPTASASWCATRRWRSRPAPSRASSVTWPVRWSTCSSDEFKSPRSRLEGRAAVRADARRDGRPDRAVQLDHRKPKKLDVAAHLVNLAWNGLSGLEKKPTLTDRPGGRREHPLPRGRRPRVPRSCSGRPATRSTGSSPPGSASARTSTSHRSRSSRACHGSPATSTVHRGADFAAHGLEPWEFDVLAALRRAGAPYRADARSADRRDAGDEWHDDDRIDRLAGRDPGGRRRTRRTVAASRHGLTAAGTTRIIDHRRWRTCSRASARRWPRSTPPARRPPGHPAAGSGTRSTATPLTTRTGGRG